MEPGRAINGVIQKKFKVCGLLGESPAEIHSQPLPVQCVWRAGFQVEPNLKVDRVMDPPFLEDLFCARQCLV